MIIPSEQKKSPSKPMGVQIEMLPHRNQPLAPCRSIGRLLQRHSGCHSVALYGNFIILLTFLKVNHITAWFGIIEFIIDVLFDFICSHESSFKSP